LNTFRRKAKDGFTFVEDLVTSSRQKMHALKKFEVDGSRTIHLLTMKRAEYLLPTIKCINSIWFHAPETRVKIWVDDSSKIKLNELKRKFHRLNQLEFIQIPLPNSEWQLNKLSIALDWMSSKDIFTDVDMYWNGKPPLVSEKPLFFVSEYDMSRRTLTRYVIKSLGLNIHREWFMLNVSVISMGNLVGNKDFKNRALELYSKLRNIEADEVLGEDDVASVRRMAEQIALSIAVQERGSFLTLKEHDGYMDGGLAESYYLGAVNGFD